VNKICKHHAGTDSTLGTYLYQIDLHMHSIESESAGSEALLQLKVKAWSREQGNTEAGLIPHVLSARVHAPRQPIRTHATK
jgi:hypothetical protein